VSGFGTFARMHRPTSTRHRVLLVAPAAALLLLAGCTVGTPTAPETTPPPPVVSTPSPTPTQTETPAVDVTVKPERPAAMDEPPTVEGAVAVAEYFQLLFPYAFATGDLADWAALSHPECLYCVGVTDDVRSMFAAGQHTKGGAFTITDSSGTEVDPGAWYTAQIRLTQEPSTTLDAGGQIVEEFPDVKTGVIDIALVWEAGAWKVREATPTADGSS
jgi:hypothetical protein